MIRHFQERIPYGLFVPEVPVRLGWAPALSLNGPFGISGTLKQSHCGLMPANLITLPHFSVSSAMSLPKSAGEPASVSAPRSASAFSVNRRGQH